MNALFNDGVKRERETINFIESRDGKKEAARFAKQSMKIYRECLKQDGKNGRKFHHASLPQYRPRFVAACVVWRNYIRGNK
jgi:hypothetical protein